jgi:spermidine synthase
MPAEKIVFETHSSFNLIAITEDSSGMRTLRFGREGICQSVIRPQAPWHLELPYARAVPACFAFVAEPLRMLIVGLGGGTLAGFFHRHFPDMAIDVVEIDADVLDVARRFCGFREDDRLRVHIEDARDFVETHRECYDVIMLDGFDAESIPEHLITCEFLEAVRLALTGNGIAIANIWGPGVNRRYGDMMVTYREVFESVYVLDVPGPRTKIFIALKEHQSLVRSELITLSHEIAQQRGFDYDIRDSIAGFRPAQQERLRGGNVLRDPSVKRTPNHALRECTRGSGL